MRNWDKLGAKQRSRYERAGITREAYEGGISLQHARGHKSREHVTRYERNPLSLRSSDYRFLKAQQRRAGVSDFSGPTKAYRKLSLATRARLHAQVASLNRQYKRDAHGVSGEVLGKGTAGLRREFETFTEDEGVDEIDEDFYSDLAPLLFYH